MSTAGVAQSCAAAYRLTAHQLCLWVLLTNASSPPQLGGGVLRRFCAGLDTPKWTLPWFHTSIGEWQSVPLCAMDLPLHTYHLAMRGVMLLGTEVSGFLPLIAAAKLNLVLLQVT